MYNEADDDGFMDCTAKDVVFENMTMLQLGGYDGIVQVSLSRQVSIHCCMLTPHGSNPQVSDGLTTLIDVTLNCSSSGCGVWLRPGSACTLVMHRCKVLGSSSSAVQVGGGIIGGMVAGKVGWRWTGKLFFHGIGRLIRLV